LVLSGVIQDEKG
jgi:hypothetical protein